MGKLLRQQQFRGALRNGAWSGDGRAVLLPLDAGLSYLEVETGLERFFISDPLAGAPPLVASADSRLLACLKPSRGGAKGQSAPVAVWEALTGKEVAMVAIGRVDHLAVAPDGRSLVTTDEEFLHVWDLASGRERHRWPLPMAGFNYWGKTFVLSLLLSPDGRRAFTALADGTALVWNLEPALRPAEPLVKQPGEKEFAAWWTDLASEDANRAYAASWRLAEAADEAVAFLRKHLKPAANSDAKEVRQLLASLDSETFADREKAFKRLDDLGDVVEPALRAALEGNPSAEVRRQLERLLARRKGLVRSPEDLRGLRAIQVLEWIASKQARDLLAELARGVAHVAQTREAKESLERLARRATGP